MHRLQAEHSIQNQNIMLTLLVRGYSRPFGVRGGAESAPPCFLSLEAFLGAGEGWDHLT